MTPMMMITKPAKTIQPVHESCDAMLAPFLMMTPS